ncbi:MAG: hypothetical protein JNJ58_03240 [Chitinophagaceae bacterium]|nr:hypothetical protein [Chitinophagaceae bacterium]
MKKIVITLASMAFFGQLSAQNEVRLGFFTGINKTSLYNTKDAAFGDYVPTFKPTVGIEGGYHFTLFKALPMGISLQASHNRLGQNYSGNYQDSTSYFAYSRLNYFRMGAALNFSSNPRRQLALTFSMGATMGILTSYQDRYELVRYNNDRYIMDIRNSEVILFDTAEVRGSISEPLYNKTDMTVFGTLGFDMLISKSLVFGCYGRFDYGMGSTIENNKAKLNINYETNPPTTYSYKPFNLETKYRGPVDDNITRSATTNRFYGIYFSLKYRLYNREKIEFYYKEADKYK